MSVLTDAQRNGQACVRCAITFTGQVRMTPLDPHGVSVVSDAGERPILLFVCTEGCVTEEIGRLRAQLSRAEHTKTRLRRRIHRARRTRAALRANTSRQETAS
ncbi:hypothetical protein [Nocardia sp. NPDC058633]|uniref:hypothetical protein n=1 Tax=Nocardia sp. NPDC058633 TaxID=3346568 RepID=UPI0036611FB4